MTTDPTLTEERSLLRAAQAGDEQAFGRLVEPYRRAPLGRNETGFWWRRHDEYAYPLTPQTYRRRNNHE